MNEKTMIEILLKPHQVIICKQDPRRCHQLHLCDCPECRDADRWEEAKMDWLGEREDEARDMEEEIDKGREGED